jgi:DNA-binding IclR family transcriptional regulator
VFVTTPSYRHVVVVHNCGAPPRRWDLLPAPSSAPGKVLLAHRPDWRRAVTAPGQAANLPMPPEIERDAERTRQRGFAIEAAEHAHGPHAVAVAIPSRDDQAPIAALTAVIAPGPDESAASIARRLSVTAEQLCKREQTRLRDLPRLPWAGSHNDQDVEPTHHHEVSP